MSFFKIKSILLSVFVFVLFLESTATFAEDIKVERQNVCLSELEVLSSDVHGGLIWDRAYMKGSPILIAGKQYSKGLTMAPRPNGSYAVFNLDGKYKRFSAVVGVMDYCKASDGVNFVVKSDKNIQIFESGRLIPGESKVVDVDVEGCRQLRLETQPISNSMSDHAFWAEVSLVVSLLKPVSFETGEVMFEDNFEVSKPEKWQPVRGDWKISEGRYIELSDFAGDDFEMWTVSGERAWDNYSFECDVKTLDGAGSIYLGARWLGEDDHYELEFVNSGTAVNLNLMRNGERHVLEKKKNVCADGPDKRVIKLRLDVQGKSLRGFVDDQCVVWALDDTFECGKIALGGAFRQPMFDNVRVAKLNVSGNESFSTKKEIYSVEFPKTRSVFEREEKTGLIKAIVSNVGKAELKEAVLQYSIKGFQKWDVKIPILKSEEQTEVLFNLPVERMRAEDYKLKWELVSDKGIEQEGEIELTIVRRPNPNRLRVLAWGTGDSRELSEHGFTGSFMNNPRTTIQCEKSRGREGAINTYMTQVLRKEIDEALKYSLDYNIQYQYVLPAGVANREYSENIAKWYHDNFGDLPAFSGVNIYTEVESHGGTRLKDFADIEKKYESATGLKYPSELVYAFGTNGQKINDLPVDGIIADDYPAYVFYKWFWMEGDGWPGKFREVAAAFKSHDPSFLTFHDPALRMPSLKNRYEGLDLINHWHYTTRDPKNLAFTIDSMFAAAAEGQKVGHMVQLLWPATVGTPEIVQARPDIGTLKPSSYIAPSPHVVREATWISLSRPIDMLAYHGIGTVRETLGGGPYVFSNPDTYEELKLLGQKLWQPYGTLFTRLEKHQKRAAFLASTANRLFSSVQTGYLWDYAYYGNYYEAIQNAHVPTDVLFEDDIKAGALDNYDVLFLPRCEVIPRSVYEKILAFARSGKPVFADDWLVPKIPGAIKITFSDISRKIKAKDRKMKILQKARLIRSALRGRFELEYDCDSTEVIMNAAKAKGITYLFVINDKRRAGNYVGQFGNVLEEGVPQSVKVEIKSNENFVLYDMLEQNILASKRIDDKLTFNLELGPCEGRIIALYPRPISDISVSGPKEIMRNGNFKLYVDFLDKANENLPGVQPLRLSITDSGSRMNEYSGYYAGVNGKFSIEFPAALNDSTGFWKFEVEDLTSGKKATYFEDLK